MSKTKKTGAGHYEILFVVPNRFTDEEAKSIVSQVEKTLADAGGQITRREYWGKKRLAYEIKNNAYGYYALFEFNLEGKSLAKIDAGLRLSNDILRHQIVIKKEKNAEQMAKERDIKVKIESKKAAAQKEAEEKSKKAAAKGKEKKVELKDLDEKLEGILNADDLL